MKTSLPMWWKNDSFKQYILLVSQHLKADKLVFVFKIWPVTQSGFKSTPGFFLLLFPLDLENSRTSVMIMTRELLIFLKCCFSIAPRGVKDLLYKAPRHGLLRDRFQIPASLEHLLYVRFGIFTAEPQGNLPVSFQLSAATLQLLGLG